VQVADGLKPPVLFVVNVIVPVGVVGFDVVSITFAMQVVATLTVTEPGEQVTLVCVAWPVVTCITLAEIVAECESVPLVPVTVTV
jgi:hypothetical protein